jgi:hypothetical protein
MKSIDLTLSLRRYSLMDSNETEFAFFSGINHLL